MKTLFTQVEHPSDPKRSITISPDPEGDATKVLITEYLRIQPKSDEIGRRCSTLVDDDGNVVAVLVG